MKARYLLSILATVAVLLVSLAYLSIGVLKLRVGSDMTTVTISAPKSNGLHSGSAVLFRGVPIGEVTDIAYAGTGTVDVTVSYDSRYEIPTSSKLVIENQSMLGESGLFLTPDAGDTGPLITSGQNLSATVVDVPASVPELLGSTQTLLDQVDPTLVNDLVNTISEALVGTEGAVERLTPAAQLVAATLIYSQPDLVTIIRNATTMLQRGEWMGPSLRPVSPQMEYVGRSLRSVITEVRPFADFTQGGKLIRERWKPTLERAATMVSTIAPPIGELAEVLVPAARRSGAPLANLDMASLLNQALLTMPGDSLRLTVTVPN